MNSCIDTSQMEEREIRQTFAKCFSNREGRIVLSFLQRITLERYLGPECPNEQLRHLEGQRHIVSYIKSLAGLS